MTRAKKKRPNKVPQNFMIDPAVLKAAKAAAQQDGRSFSSYVQEALKVRIKRKKKVDILPDTSEDPQPQPRQDKKVDIYSDKVADPLAAVRASLNQPPPSSSGKS